MVLNGAERFQKMWNGVKFCQMVLNGAECLGTGQMLLNGAKWCKTVLNHAEWCECYQLVLNGAKY